VVITAEANEVVEEDEEAGAKDFNVVATPY